MSREAALELIRSLSHGLPADLAGERRLLERIASSDHAEELRGALIELGAAALLCEPRP